jgi:coenzyme F420-reducing hydrogenase delta subunit
MSANVQESKAGQSIVVLYCRQCMALSCTPAPEVHGDGFTARMEMIPCSSKIEVSHILKILDEGADGVEVIACPEKECRFLIGSLRAKKRIDYVRRLLGEIDVGAEAVGISRGMGLTAEHLADVASARAEAIRKGVER